MLQSASFLQAMAMDLPEKIVTSQMLEERLSPLYERLKLNYGRLELMTGVKQRHVGEVGERPSVRAVAASRKLLATRPEGTASKIDLLIYAGVCRDCLEPATASVIHAELGLSPHCLFFDLSNACLGMLNAWWIASQLIESGKVQCALVVASENSGPVLEQTIRLLNANSNTNDGISRRELKKYIASLTLGSGALASLLTGPELQTANSHQLVATSFLSHTEANALCRGGGSVDGMMMETDSEKLLQAGLQLAAANWQKAKLLFPWDIRESNHFITHQVGEAHHRLLVEALGLVASRAPQYYAKLGNTGSVALPMALALLDNEKKINKGETLALLGIGSGLGSLIMGVIW